MCSLSQRNCIKFKHNQNEKDIVVVTVVVAMLHKDIVIT